MKKRKIIVFIILAVCVLLALYSMHKSEIEYINREIDSYYYSEQDVNNLEYLLEEYNSNPINEEKRKIIINDLLNSARFNNYQFTDGDIREYIDELERNSDDYSIYDHDFYYNDVLIKKGDYHNLAIALLNDRNDELTDEYVANNIINLQDQIEVIVIFIFAILYVYFVFKFSFFTSFDKKTYIKNTVKYLVTLLIIFTLNIAVCFAVEKYINYLGHYRGRGFYQFSNVPNILNYGILNLLNLFIVFIISLIVYSLFNIKDIKNYFKKKVVKK